MGRCQTPAPRAENHSALCGGNTGQGLLMENNVFINANYAWPFYVTNTKYLDNETYFNNTRWRALPNKWYASGTAYARIDSIDGTPNPWLHRWLQHPAFDAYWQASGALQTRFRFN